MTHLPCARLECLSASDSLVLLDNARLLQHSEEPRQIMLRGKKLALLCEAEGPDGLLFREAANDLGAHVSCIRPRLGELPRTADLQQTVRLLGLLYDGIECQGLSHDLVELVGRESSLPVYDGLACERHPTARLAALLDADVPAAKRRQLVLQTALLSTLT